MSVIHNIMSNPQIQPKKPQILVNRFSENLHQTSKAQMALQLPHTFRPHKVVVTQLLVHFMKSDMANSVKSVSTLFSGTSRPHKVVVTCLHQNRRLWYFLQRSYKQKPPPGKSRDVEKETGHVLRFKKLASSADAIAISEIWNYHWLTHTLTTDRGRC